MPQFEKSAEVFGSLCGQINKLNENKKSVVTQKLLRKKRSCLKEKNQAKNPGNKDSSDENTSPSTINIMSNQSEICKKDLTNGADERLQGSSLAQVDLNSCNLPLIKQREEVTFS